MSNRGFKIRRFTFCLPGESCSLWERHELQCWIVLMERGGLLKSFRELPQYIQIQFFSFLSIYPQIPRWFGSQGSMIITVLGGSWSLRTISHLGFWNSSPPPTYTSISKPIEEKHGGADAYKHRKLSLVPQEKNKGFYLPTFHSWAQHTFLCKYTEQLRFSGSRILQS